MDSNKKVGNRIKLIRESKSITIECMAEQTDMSIEQIKCIEDGTDIPSLSPLIKISHVLGVCVGSFLDDQCDKSLVICRKDKCIDVISFSNNSVDSRKNMVYHSLFKSKSEHCLSPFIVNIMPAEIDKYELLSHEGEEFIYVLEGSLELVYGKDKYRFNKGDSVYYDSIVPHCLHGYDGKVVKILSVLYTPV